MRVADLPLHGAQAPRLRGHRSPASSGEVASPAAADGSTPEACPPAVGRGGRAPEALRQACQQFEAVLLAKLLEKMRDTVPEDPLLGDSRAQDVYHSMMDWELAQQVARTQGVGLAEMLYRQLSAYLGNRDGDAETAPPGDG